tara:strand:- start:264 stop:848 length:585 start_codon:yes stop_codon:yes gene_type:complete
MLSSSDDLLYMYINGPIKDPPLFWSEASTKTEIQEYIDKIVEADEDDEGGCYIKMYRGILSYCDNEEYSNYRRPLFYRIASDHHSNHLCFPVSMKWNSGHELDFFRGSFNYINSIYNIYEIDEWPKWLPPPPIKKSNEECSEDYIKQNINKMECHQRCCGWPHSGYVCGMDDDDQPVPIAACIKEKNTFEGWMG